MKSSTLAWSRRNTTAGSPHVVAWLRPPEVTAATTRLPVPSLVQEALQFRGHTFLVPGSEQPRSSKHQLGPHPAQGCDDCLFVLRREIRFVKGHRRRHGKRDGETPTSRHGDDRSAMRSVASRRARVGVHSA